MELVVTGANGLLGSNIIACALDDGVSVVAAYHNLEPEFGTETVQLDITEKDRFADILQEYRPNAVVNCAALTDVDACEHAAEQAYEVNGEAPGRLAKQAAKYEAEFVHISTDYVFGGGTDQPYEEGNQREPKQVYGESKLLGERRVSTNHSKPLIPRLSFVWGRHGMTGELEGFPAWVRERLQADESVPLFVDQHITPTRAGQAAESILTFLRTGASGVYHLACRSCVTPYIFGSELAEVLGHPSTLLTESSADDVSRDAERPLYTCLDVSKAETALGRSQPTLREDIETII